MICWAGIVNQRPTARVATPDFCYEQTQKSNQTLSRAVRSSSFSSRVSRRDGNGRRFVDLLHREVQGRVG